MKHGVVIPLKVMRSDWACEVYIFLFRPMGNAVQVIYVTFLWDPVGPTFFACLVQALRMASSPSAGLGGNEDDFLEEGLLGGAVSRRHEATIWLRTSIGNELERWL